MPPHDTYIEPFAGTGAVLLRKPPAARSVVVDLDLRPLAAIRAARPDVECVDASAFAVLDGLDDRTPGRVLIYADPPYLYATRTGNKRYKHELTDEHHRALRLPLSPAKVIVSGYLSPFYDSLLSGWRTVEFQAMSRGGVWTEKLWMNYEPTAVHWASYARRNFTDWQRIKRKVARWAENYRVLPPGDRLAVLAALLETEARGLRSRARL